MDHARAVQRVQRLRQLPSAARSRVSSTSVASGTRGARRGARMAVAVAAVAVAAAAAPRHGTRSVIAAVERSEAVAGGARQPGGRTKVMKSTPSTSSMVKNQSSLLADEIVEADDVGMAHVGERAKLLLEAIEAGGVELAQRLQRHAHVALVVVGLVDEPFAAFAELADQLETLGPAKCHARSSVGASAA